MNQKNAKWRTESYHSKGEENLLSTRIVKITVND